MPHVEMKEGLTPRQIERQRVRENGKYANYPNCELCDKKVNPEGYWSDPRCNATGVGLILCKKCCHKSEQMSNKVFLETFAKCEDAEYIKRHQTILRKEFPDRE
jgi:hypothetical protein